MRLRELSPTFLRIKSEDPKVYAMIDDIASADGISFLCPKCFVANGGPKGTHQVVCWAPHVPQSFFPVPGRWKLEGTSYDDLSLRAGSSSILLLGGCAWHGYVSNGEILPA